MFIRIVRCLACVGLILFCLPALAVTIYRCDSPEGPVFRDRPCAQGVVLELDAPRARSSASGLRPGERAWLRAIRRREARPRQAGRSEPKGMEQARARRCWRKRQQLEAVRHRLRRGYLAAEGERLRQLRRRHEDYLSRFCD